MPQSKTVSRGNPTPKVARPAEDGFPLDPADIFAGILLLIAIPAITYLVLGLAGMPVTGPALSATQRLERKEALEERAPPLTSEELEARVTLASQLLRDRFLDYQSRSRAAENAVRKDFWQQCGNRVLDRAMSLLNEAEQELGKSTPANASAIAQEITSRKRMIEQYRAEMEKERAYVK